MSEETTGNQQGTEKKGSGMFGKLVGIVLVLAVIVIAGYYAMKQGGSEETAVAVVNGEKISRSEYDARYAQLEASIAAQGQSATSTEVQAKIKNQTLDNLVTETLLLQAAKKESIKVNDGDVNTQLTQSKSQFPDAATFEKALKDQGYTDATYKAYLMRTNLIQQYITAHVDIASATSTDAEVKALYAQAKATDPTIPPLAQVRAQAENQIVQQKQQQLIMNFIQQLRASSTIQTLLK